MGFRVASLMVKFVPACVVDHVMGCDTSSVVWIPECTVLSLIAGASFCWLCSLIHLKGH